MFKNIAVLFAALALSAPALADRGHHRFHGHGHEYGYGHGHYKHKHRAVVHHVYHHPTPPPVVVHHYYRPAPPPVYVVHRHEPMLPLLVGAVIGAAVVHHAVSHY